jgi:hypothetical protein
MASARSVGPRDKLFVDTLPVHYMDGALELVRRGVEVYYLRRLILIEKMRMELKLPRRREGRHKGPNEDLGEMVQKSYWKTS